MLSINFIAYSSSIFWLIVKYKKKNIFSPPYLEKYKINLFCNVFIVYAFDLTIKFCMTLFLVGITVNISMFPFLKIF